MHRKTFDGNSLFKDGNHVKKYRRGPGLQNHLVAKITFDVEGHLSNKMSTWVKFSNLCILSCRPTVTQHQLWREQLKIE